MPLSSGMFSQPPLLICTMLLVTPARMAGGWLSIVAWTQTLPPLSIVMPLVAVGGPKSAGQ